MRRPPKRILAKKTVANPDKNIQQPYKKQECIRKEHTLGLQNFNFFV